LIRSCERPTPCRRGSSSALRGRSRRFSLGGRRLFNRRRRFRLRGGRRRLLRRRRRFRGGCRLGGRGVGHGDQGRGIRALVQALQVAAQRVDFLVGQRLGDLGHDVEQVRIAFTGGAGAIFLQATGYVVRLLAADVRVGRARVAGAGG